MPSNDDLRQDAREQLWEMQKNNCCPCGGIILADTEKWITPLCHECWVPYTRVDVPTLMKQVDSLKYLLGNEVDQNRYVERQLSIGASVSILGIWATVAVIGYQEPFASFFLGFFALAATVIITSASYDSQSRKKY